MDKKKKLIVIIALLTAALVLLLYWSLPVSLQRFFPDGKWYYDMSLMGMFFEGHIQFQVDEEAAGEIFEQLSGAKLKRALPFDSFRGDALTVHTFYDEEGSWLMILLIDDGRVRVSDFEKKKDYYLRGEEELYNSIYAITEELPVENRTEMGN